MANFTKLKLHKKNVSLSWSIYNNWKNYIKINLDVLRELDKNVDNFGKH